MLKLTEALDLQKRAIIRREKASTKTDEVRHWLMHEVEVLVSTVDAEYSLENLMRDRASLTCMLEKFKNSNDPNETKIAQLTAFLDFRNTQITDLQQKIVESDQEDRVHTRWQKIHSMEEAKAALKILFNYTAENRRKQCVKETEYNELLEKTEQLRAQLTEYHAKEKERRLSKQLILNSTHTIHEFGGDDNTTLKEQLEHIKQKCEQLEQKVLKSKVDKTKNKENVIPDSVKTQQIEESFIDMDESIDDDVEKDPDWTQTSLYKRIQKLLKATKNFSLDRTTVKRTSDGEVKCSCKRKCATRVCTCRKNKKLCGINCNCNLTTLKEQLEHFKQKCEQLEQKVLKSKVDKTKNKENVIPDSVKTQQIEESFIDMDESIDDDVEKDPDWTQTPFYNHIQKLLKATKNFSLDRTTVKRTSDGEVKCSCITKCATRVCTCHKNKKLCGINCNCNLENCKNRETKNLNPILLSDYKEEEESDDSIKKLRNA